jgi:formylglycine-generating enzyme required for sulfatase activity/serine/threonine protein kinase
MIFNRDFRVVKALRAGGMGAVYVVDQLSTGKQRALKVMSATFAQSPAARERFVLEARAGSRIESDHVVEVLTAGIDAESGAPYLVMELLRGEELADAMKRLGPLPLGDVAEVLTQMGHGLAQAHAQGIVHRDLKPENIFLAGSRRKDAPFTAKILDFGIAKLYADTEKTGTQPLGTPLFMSPEQTERKGRIAPATDVWALGLMTFKMLTGRDFWHAADGGSLAGVLREICVNDIPAASARAREMGVDRYLPPGFDAWFARCVTRNQEDRFQEAGAAVDAFVELAGPQSRTSALKIEAPAPMSGRIDISSPLTADEMIGGAPSSVRPNEWQGAGSPGPGTRPLAGTGVGASTGTPGPLMTSGGAEMAPAAPLPAQKGSSKILLVLAPIAAAVGVGAYFLLQTKAPPPPIPSAPPSASAAAAMGSGAAAASGSPSAAAAAGPGRCPDGMALISGGKMFMGARDLNADAKPPHEVSISTFCLDRTEVTASAYLACVSTGECERPLEKVSWPNIKDEQVKRYSPLCNASAPNRSNHPINCVAWGMADMFCRKKGARLPTEAEWEFAARGSNQRKYPWGDQEPNEKLLNACDKSCEAWSAKNMDAHETMHAGDDGFLATAPVGSFPAGAAAQGLMDMAGNVWEWTADWYAPYTEAPQTDPKGPSDPGDKRLRVLRGGDFFSSNADWARPAYRWKTDPETYNHAIGFRCAADVK